MQTRLWGFVVGVVATACSTEPSVDLGGQWDLSESFVSSTGVSCEGTGDLLLNQFDNGARVSGQRSRAVTCDGETGLILDGTHSVINGNVDGENISFEIDFCEYEGTVEDSRMSGTLNCPGIGEPPISFTGTWSAMR